MIKKRYGIPALVLGLAMIGGTSAYAAFGPGSLDMSAFSDFSATQQSAIKEAQEIRDSADEEARAVLEAAGVSQEDMRDAMQAYHETKHAAGEAALEANDFDAFKATVAGTPMEDKLTEDTFATLVKIHSLMESGDKEGAMELRKELGDAGMMGGPMGFPGHRGMGEGKGK